MKPRVHVMALALLALWPAAASAERFEVGVTDVSSIDVLDAVATLRDGLARWAPCPHTFRPTGASVTVETSCPEQGLGSYGRYFYQDNPTVRMSNPWFGVHARDRVWVRTPSRMVGGGWRLDYASDEEFRAIGRAWIALAQPRTPRDPSTDSEFLAAIQAQLLASDEESLRRVQVQVEAAMRGNRNIDAARLYRDALRTSPAWADGHYNLGLLYGDLEFFPEAITEMRRYLYLTPNAQDVRAVQDKIYEWEAAMAGAGQ